MTQHLDRRGFFRDSLKYAGGALVAAPTLAGLAACNDVDPTAPSGSPELARARRNNTFGYGDLVPANGGLPFLIPAGFTLKRLSLSGDQMVGGGGEVPYGNDGMAAFAMDNGQVRLVRNHEMRDAAGAGVVLGDRPYDSRSSGGTTTIVLDLDPVTGEPTVRREFVSIGGTAVNCAGGPTPQKSWLTCEETTVGTTAARGGFGQKHGYIFEVPAGADSVVDPVPLRDMGRFSHEAVAVDPRDNAIYLTEDQGNNSGFYRFTPRSATNLALGGTLEMLAVVGQDGFNATGRTVAGRTAPGVPPFVPLATRWVTIDRPDPDLETTATDTVFSQGFAKGGVRFSRLEGCWWSDTDECIYFNDTNGGAVGAGRVWQYRPGSGQLTLIFESPSADVLDAPDNICVSPRGGIVICEDGGGTQFLRGLTRNGQIFDFVRAADPVDATEFAGSCFSSDGRVLFFNTQGSTLRQPLISVPEDNPDYQIRGGTYAIWGPWSRGAL